jgi:hypothetical protein
LSVGVLPLRERPQRYTMKVWTPTTDTRGEAKLAASTQRNAGDRLARRRHAGYPARERARRLQEGTGLHGLVGRRVEPHDRRVALSAASPEAS